MGGPDPARRTRAIGIRDRVLTYLADGEVSDPKGMAAAVLADGVGYPGSSAAFAQLLSGMERSGLIERQIRGKRTYRIAAAGNAGRQSAGPGNRAPAGQAGPSAPAAAGRAGQQATAGAAGAAGDRRSGPGTSLPSLPSAGGGEAGFDYDELARRLLIQVVRRLANAQADTPPLEPEEAGDAALQQTVASLETKLASAASQQRKLTAENAKLRKQLQAARQSLAQAEERAKAVRVTGELGGPELQLLERLLSASRDQTGRQEEAGAS
jgi:hypothetical protein